jgi:hypothetical protein
MRYIVSAYANNFHGIDFYGFVTAGKYDAIFTAIPREMRHASEGLKLIQRWHNRCSFHGGNALTLSHTRAGKAQMPGKGGQ